MTGFAPISGGLAGRKSIRAKKGEIAQYAFLGCKSIIDLFFPFFFFFFFFFDMKAMYQIY